MLSDKTKAFIKARVASLPTTKKKRRKKKGRIKKGWFEGVWCDSGWELAYILYCRDHNIKLIRNTRSFPYVFRGKLSNYYPDFLIEGTDHYVEIKGKVSKMWEAKLRAFPHPIKTLYASEMKPILTYVHNKYGDQFWKMLDTTKKRPHPSKSV